MIGGNNLQIVIRQGLPERSLIGLSAQGGGTDGQCPLHTRRIESIRIQEQILRAGFSANWQTFVARGLDSRDDFFAGNVKNMNGDTKIRRQINHSPSGFSFQDRGATSGMPLRRSVAILYIFLDQCSNRIPIFGMNHGQATGITDRFQCLKQLSVVQAQA